MTDRDTWPHNQTWSEDINFPGHMHTIEVNADSYNQWIRDVCFYTDPRSLSDDAFEPGTGQMEVFKAQRSKKMIKAAKNMPRLRVVEDLGEGWKFGIRTFPYYKVGAVDWLQMGLVRHRLAIYSDEDYGEFTRGAVLFTGAVHIPMLVKGSRTWMSLTPMEIYTLREAIRIARGHVLIAGLGMGWLTRRILESPKVTKVTQIEMEPMVIDFFGTPLKEMFGDKLEIIQGDVYEFLKTPHSYNSYIFDIWDSLGAAEDDEEFQELKETVNAWGWGDGDRYYDDEPEYADQAEDGFENDIACWGKDDPQQWWNLE
jgi:hypothetical protein